MQMSNHQLFYDAVCRIYLVCVLMNFFHPLFFVSKDEICRRTDDNLHNLHQLWKLVEKVNISVWKSRFCL